MKITKLLISLININFDIKKSKSKAELILFTKIKLSLIQKKILFNVLSEIISIQINKPLYIPALFILLLSKKFLH
jgi:hypothetical protein